MTSTLDDSMRALAADPTTWLRAETYEGDYAESAVTLSRSHIAYSDWNPGASEVIVMVHGLNVQRHTWDPVASVLSKRFRVITPDLRGHGDSSWSQDGYWLRNMAGDLSELLDALSIERCALVGHSLGAKVVLMTATSEPARIVCATLSDTGPEVPRTGGETAAARATRRVAKRGFNTVDEVQEQFDEEHPEWQPIFRYLHARYQVRRNWVGKLVPCADPDLFWITGSAGRREEKRMWECAAEVQVPVQFMWGARSPYVNEEILNRLRATVPNFRDERFESGHFIPRQRPKEFIESLLRFLNEHRLDGSSA